jgi:hypothetical protein
LGLLGLELEDVKTRLLQALRDNPSPVIDWVAAENTIVSAWNDGHAQKETEDARPKFVPDAAKTTGNRVLKEAVKGIAKGESLGSWGYKVGQFVPHVLEYANVLDELKEAWERAKNHDTRSLDDAVRGDRGGPGQRTTAPSVHGWQRDLKLRRGLGFHQARTTCAPFRKHLAIRTPFDVRGSAGDCRATLASRAKAPYHEAPGLRAEARWYADAGCERQPAVALEALIDLANENKRDTTRVFQVGASRTSTETIETVLIRTMGAEDSDYTRAVCRKWLVGLVARQFDPGCKMDNVLILVGDQGMSKSWFFKEIFPVELQNQAYCDSVNLLRLDKDQVVKLNRYACVELPELAGMSKADVETIKMNVTQQRADERLAYARLHAQFARAPCVWQARPGRFLRDNGVGGSGQSP